MHGELIPIGGGSPIPLSKLRMLFGRNETCDISWQFSNVSSHHCELFMEGDTWYVRDLNSKNGTKVNGVEVGQAEEPLEPGDMLTVANHRFEIKYRPGH